MNDLMMELRTEANWINSSDIPDFIVSLWGCYLMTNYIFLLLFLGQYIYSKASKFNSACVGWQSQLRVTFFSPFISCGSSLDIGYVNKAVTIDSFILFYVNWKWKGPATSFRHSRSFAAACMGGKLAFSSFPPPWRVRGKLASCSFTAAPTAGKTAFSRFPPLREEEKWQLQFYRRSHRR